IYFTDSVLKKKIYPNGEDFQYSEPIAYGLSFLGEKTISTNNYSSPNLIYINGAYRLNNIPLDTSTAVPIINYNIPLIKAAYTHNDRYCSIVVDSNISKEDGWGNRPIIWSNPLGYGSYGFGCYQRNIESTGDGDDGSTLYVNYTASAKISNIQLVQEYIRIDGTKLNIVLKDYYKVLP
ncbi:hypothetical protein, partial [Aliarcobacter thereius]|uniref:hypothetical protein n=1 Tax=Aliarcobacter thereius TaxID=544718 RepID=UPI0013F4CA8C